MVRVCPSCSRPLISAPEANIEPVECPYCAYIFDGEDDPEQQSPESPEMEVDRDTVEMIHRTQTITCNYCNHNNPFINNQCEKCGSNLTWASVSNEQTTEKKLSNQLTQEQKEKCIVVGLLAFMKTLMNREGNEDGLLWCQGCNSKYPFDSFFCPNCGGATWIAEMREVLQGSVHNRGLIEEFQKSFPRFKIIGYANSATFRSGMTNSMKIELDNIARNALKILEAGAIYLKANTQDIKKIKQSSEDNPNQSNLFGLFSEEMSDTPPDERVMEFLGSTTIHTNGDLGVIPEDELPIAQPDADPGQDWFES